ncbi:hypothetical protein RCG23_09160 [Neobacillus sp. PS3-34]|uniref:hypothetical protein n=1 Tax=Neobacillus sp. PS3-34 TaxID=3070678 RepID=UPI0027E086E3|nr:hypothetical protein [Neobacillus sp. PS3-34]WML49995.1 hypothetical protein RCG23_09160 [Neobacillus sp. PS3-34]
MFFKGRHETLAAIKEQQAKLFGKVYSHITYKQWGNGAAVMEHLAEAEEDFMKLLLETKEHISL